MEENKKTFKWGDSEYLLDDLLKMHAEQENNYYNFARDRGQYDEASLSNLRQAIANRINAVKSGEAFAADGTLQSDKADNISIQTQKKGLFKKDKYVDQDNTEWAKYYLNKLVGQLKPYKATPTVDKTAWDINKHGLQAYLTGQGLDAQSVFSNYDLYDPSNPNAVRSKSQRKDLLKQHITGYKNWLASKNFDFTKNDNDWDDNFNQDLDKFIEEYDSLDSNGIAAALRKFGAGDVYTTAFTSDRWDLNKSAEQLKLEAEQKAAQEAKESEQKKVQEEKAKEAAYLKEWEDYAFSKKRNIEPGYYRPFNYLDSSLNGKYKDFISWYGDLNDQEKLKYGTYLGKDNQTWRNAWNNLMASFRNGTVYNDKNAKILLQGTFESQPHVFTDLGDGNYLIKHSISSDGQGIIYNPKSGYTSTVFLGDIAKTNEAVRNEYRKLAYDYINNKYGTNYSTRSYVFEEGGTLIPKHQYGDQIAYNWGDIDDIKKDKAEKNGISVKTQQAKDQYLDSDNASLNNPNAGWDAKHYARLGYAIADLGSAVASFAPGGGTALSAGLGLASTVGNFITDASDDAVTSGEMWKNLGLNLGMDALGLIPGGGSATKLGKIVKTLKTTVPLIVALPGVASMLANSPEIAASWKKAFDGDSEKGGSKMDYQDYMNILQVLNVAAGITNISRNAYQSANKSVKHSDKVAVDVMVKDKKGQVTNQRKALIFEGEDAVKFKEANAEGKAQEFIDNLEGGNKYKINEITTRNVKPWTRDADGKLTGQNPFGRTATGQAKTFDLRWDSSKGHYYAETGRWDADLVGKDLVKMKGRTTLESWKQKHQKAVEADFEAWRAKAAQYKKTTDRATQLNQKVDADIATQNVQKQALDAQLNTQQRIVQEAGSEAARMKQWLDNGGAEASWNKIGDAKARIAEIDKALKKKNVPRDQAAALQTEKAKLEKAMRDAEIELNSNTPEALQVLNDQVTKANLEQTRLQTETAKLQAMLDKLNKHKTYLNTRANASHSDAYKSIKDFQAIKKKFNGTEYTFDVDPNLKNLNGLYKQGGSINRNKINKFLNYGKR